MTPTYVLTLSCPDRPGLVFAVTRWIAEAGGNILDSQQFSDTSDNEFFLRVHFTMPDDPAPEGLSEHFAKVATEHQMNFRLVIAETPARTLVLVSREGHCLNDLLYRQSAGSLGIEIPAIVSNHRDLERLAAAYEVPFHHVPTDDKATSEARLLELVDELSIDLVVLARYMQILSDETCRALDGRAINIHHSFLPSFKGARPYQQAHDRGVKLIGATAHYVTAELDEGPIIDQGVMRVDHRMSAADLARVGRDVEAQTLSRAVKLHAESRVLMNGPRTVVFA
ncbi:formyltetrahydrofolate deformylase [Aeromicrobium panaciterrae]|uniref:Formyltetrahydrofolate deformylase n=1 Tax=Aeromicrobium panaciterrae TaxID=363861 RepID=A0ABU1UR42_9ACTN|nr:formyltetrahydrofolate deformylase [Aeromicrobium panaciterrae]MDR7087663.1 formyltetrahydrofolate deformylase [Aeromicrobium panaciterrae]